MSEKKVLVTGGAGYIGSTLCRELLAREYEVRCFDILMYGGQSVKAFLNHPNFKFIKGDVRNKSELKSAMEGVDSVVHLSAIVGDAPCKRNPRLSIEVNYNSTVTCYGLAKELNVKRFLFASTSSNYGIADTSKPIPETGTLNPVSLYAETKVDCEQFLLERCKNGALTTTIFRFATAFGLSGRNRFDLLVNSFTFEALQNKKMMVFAPYTWRPYIHVLDISYLIIKTLGAEHQKIHGQVFNSGDQNMNYQKFQVVESIKKALGDGVEINLVKDTDDLRTYRVDFKKVQAALKFKASKSISDGVLEIADAIKKGVITFEDYDSNTLESISEVAKKFK